MVVKKKAAKKVARKASSKKPAAPPAGVGGRVDEILSGVHSRLRPLVDLYIENRFRGDGTNLDEKAVWQAVAWAALALRDDEKVLNEVKVGGDVRSKPMSEYATSLADSASEKPFKVETGIAVAVPNTIPEKMKAIASTAQAVLELAKAINGVNLQANVSNCRVENAGTGIRIGEVSCASVLDCSFTGSQKG